jgi:hypothetical protein
MNEKLKKPYRLLELKAFVPARTVAGYSDQEKLDFETAFMPVAEKYRRRERLGRKLMVAFFLALLTCFTGSRYPRSLIWLFLAAFIIWLIAFLALSVRVICPACSNSVKGEFGSYCPQCGGTLKRDGVLNVNDVRCSWCGIKLRKGKRRNYRIRICTYCGVKLDPIGI